MDSEEARALLYFDGAKPLASAPAGPGVSAETLRRRGALTMVVLMAGMWAWTREYGTGPQSADEVGEIVTTVGADGLWPLIVSGGAAR